ncbi:MAG TPA: 4'-phosphopantetheinyl transferase superfamily protein [Gemmatimonadales bacterium]|nr:4'-phosphopantetheinyl transferase superfamily protein [Gemmatimonadales bacterium]
MGSSVTVIGVGIDLVDLERVRSLLAHKGQQAMARFFSQQEREYLATRPDVTGHAAARIAAKEAVYKAMQSLPGARSIGWREIEVSRDAEGKPAIALHGLAARLSDQSGGLRIQISLTHSAISAGAIAVVEAP